MTSGVPVRKAGLRLLLADDHVLVRDALKSYIERDDRTAQVVVAGSLDEALQEARRAADLDLVILDYCMPGMNGFAGLAAMRRLRPEVPVAILSGLAREEEMRGAMRQGAAGYFPKTLAGPSLVMAIRLVITGEPFFPFAAAPPSPPPPAPALLTEREAEVLAQLSKGWSNKAIARALGVQEVTVKLHLRGLCRKLDARNRTEAVLKAVRLGLVPSAEAAA